MKKILITGAGGQLATAIYDKIQEQGINNNKFIFADIDTLDITNYDQCDDFIKTNNIDYLINCAAYTNVDLAELESENANAVNSLGPLYLGKLSRKYNFKLIHISTDYVYSGIKTKPYVETDSTVPKNYYGLSKLNGEKNIIANTDNYIIIRTSWLYYKSGHNFFNTMINLFNTRDKLTIVADQHGSPTYCGDLAQAILTILESNHNNYGNIYNFSNLGQTTWYDFAVTIYNKLKSINHNTQTSVSCEITPISSQEYLTAATRPRYSVLDKSKFLADFDFNIPAWQNSLDVCLDKYLEDVAINKKVETHE